MIRFILTYTLLISIAFAQKVDWNHWSHNREEIWKILKSQSLASGTPYIMLQLFEANVQRDFENLIISKLPVGQTYADFNAWNKFKLVNSTDYSKYDYVTIGEMAILEALKRNGKNKFFILFNLTNFDPDKAWGRGKKVRGVTQAEIEMIFNQPHYLKSTIFFRDGRPMTGKELKRFFSPYLDIILTEGMRRHRSRCVENNLAQILENLSD